MQVGVASVDITPRPGAELSGFLARVQPSVDVHDSLAARALYLDDGRQRLLWLHADVVGFEWAFVQEVKYILTQEMHLRAEQVVISATHTHSGPATLSLINAGTRDLAYMAWLKDRLIEAARDAAGRSEPAEMLFAEGTCTLAADRRGGPNAHTDPRVPVFAWRREDGSYAAVLTSYGIHNVALRAENRSISGDMAGVAATRISAALPGSPVVLFANGACGNLNPPAVTSKFVLSQDSPPDFERMERWGGMMADAVLAAVGQLRSPGDQNMATNAETFDLRLQPFTVQEVRFRAARLREVMADEQGYVADRYRDSVDTWENLLAEQMARQDGTPTSPVEIQVVRLGDIDLVCLGAEVFSRMADELRQATGRAVYIIGYANGDSGYLAPEFAYDEGGYEIDSAFVFYGGLPVQRGEFERLRDRLTTLIKEKQTRTAEEVH